MAARWVLRTSTGLGAAGLVHKNPHSPWDIVVTVSVLGNCNHDWQHVDQCGNNEEDDGSSRERLDWVVNFVCKRTQPNIPGNGVLSIQNKGGPLAISESTRRPRDRFRGELSCARERGAWTSDLQGSSLPNIEPDHPRKQRDPVGFAFKASQCRGVDVLESNDHPAISEVCDQERHTSFGQYQQPSPFF